MSGIGVGLSACFLRPGMGRGAGLSLARTTSGLIVFEDFTGANSSLPDGWEQTAGSGWGIQGNEMACSPSASPTLEYTGGPSRQEWFAQCFMRMGNQSTDPRMILLWDNDSQGYLIGPNNSGNDLLIHEWDGNVFTLVAQAGGGAIALADNDELDIQTFVDQSGTGEQEVWIKKRVGGATQFLQASDGTHTTAETFGFMVPQGGDPNSCEVDDLLLCKSKNIVVTGLDTGQKAKVLEAGGSTVAEATESSGTATIDCTRNSGATELVPGEGWSALIVTDSGDNELFRYDAAGVYPGDEYELS